MKAETVRLIYTQEADSCAPGGEEQVLSVETDDAGSGSYVVIATDRWAIDPEGIDAFAAELRRVLALVEPAQGGEAA